MIIGKETAWSKYGTECLRSNTQISVLSDAWGVERDLLATEILLRQWTIMEKSLAAVIIFYFVRWTD